MSKKQSSRLALAFIFITMFVDTIGLGMIIPVAPQIISQLIGHGLPRDLAMSEAARWGGWLFFVFALMQFLCAPLIGNLSDRFGRRPVLIASLLALGVDYLITGLAPTIAWLFIGRFLSGIAGASYTTVNAYIADVSPPEKRAANFGLTGAAFSLGFIVGPAIGGQLGQFGPRLPFFVSAGLALLNALFGVFVLKESLAKENRRKFDWRRANPIGALHAMSRFPMILGLCAVTIFMRLAHDANPAVFTFYTMLKFHWDSQMVGYSLMAVGAMMAVVYSFLIRLVIPRIGEAAAVYFGLTFGAVAFAGYAFSTQGWMIFAWMLPFSLMGFAMPALNAIMSKMVGPTEQGELQGALACIGGLTSIAAPPLLTQIFGYFTSPSAPVYFPGAAFLTASLCVVAAALVFAYVNPRRALSPAE
ncbi:MAG: TCR/Tet family MFS transporter [Proteobacteria bacterium]|nr:TCR/Tet family MFS transporter [Pseudomonadota bacterium]